MSDRILTKTIAVLCTALSLIGCSGNLPDASDWTSFALRDVPEYLIEGEVFQISARVKYGPERETVYDFVKDDLELKVEVNSDIAQYLGGGLVKVTSPGLLTLYVTSGIDTGMSEQATVKVLERTYENVIGQSLHSRLVCASTTLKHNASMQSFAVSADGSFYLSAIYGERACIQKLDASGELVGDPMTVFGRGDGMCFAIEETDGEVFLWFCSDVGLIVRERFAEGISVSLESCQDCYSFGEHDYLRVAVDCNDDRIAVCTSTDEKLKIYSLSGLKSLPKTEGVADATQYAPVCELNMTISGTDSFCMYDSKYCISGGGVNDAVITAGDSNGYKFFTRLPFAVDDNSGKLVSYGLSDTGDFEPSGVVYANGSLYHGFRSSLAGYVKNTIIKFGEMPLESINSNSFNGTHEAFEMPV